MIATGAEDSLWLEMMQEVLGGGEYIHTQNTYTRNIHTLGTHRIYTHTEYTLRTHRISIHTEHTHSEHREYIWLPSLWG